MLRVDERVERLEQPPDRRRSRPGGRRADTARYLHSLSLGADGATLGGVPEGDSLHRAARRLRVLVGERLEVEAPHPRGQLTGVAEQLGRPWLVLRGSEHEAIQMNGPVLELQSDVRRRLGPDILAQPPEFDGMLGNLRAAPQGQRLVAGVGNMWMSEALWEARLSPWLRLGDATDEDLSRALEAAHRLMSDSVAGVRGRRRVYRRPGRPCPRCGALVSSRGQGDANRTAYWCPGCQGSPRGGRGDRGRGARA